jgi:flavin reductase (DIM6/NTAB) family NADH-FMN oxidoreductase RutF
MPEFGSTSVSGAADRQGQDRRDQFIEAMSQAVSSVVVVTTDGPAGRAGLTVSAMSSVSADGPHPTLLICVHHLSPVAPAIIRNGVFCVNLLGSSQATVSDCFAGRRADEFANKFDSADWSCLETDAPALEGALVNFDCRLLESSMVSTHHIFVAEVVAVRMDASHSVLAYSKRDYCQVAPTVRA